MMGAAGAGAGAEAWARLGTEHGAELGAGRFLAAALEDDVRDLRGLG